MTHTATRCGITISQKHKLNLGPALQTGDVFKKIILWFFDKKSLSLVAVSLSYNMV